MSAERILPYNKLTWLKSCELLIYKSVAQKNKTKEKAESLVCISKYLTFLLGKMEDNYVELFDL